jgi:hypothetical protein
MDTLKDGTFDLYNWYKEELQQLETQEPFSSSESYDLAEYSGSELDANSLESHPSSLSETDPSMPSLREVTNSSVGSSRSSDHGPMDDDLPGLETCSDSSDDTDSGGHGGVAESVTDTFEEHLELWAQAAEECSQRKTRADQLQREHQLGDVLGNTVAMLLDFFQPYPGDESIPWSDERRCAVRFRVLRVGSENYTIEDTYCDKVTVLPLKYLRVPAFHLVEWYAGQRAMELNLEYNQVLPIHHFPIEEILADAVQQYF